jgi:chitinase
MKRSTYLPLVMMITACFFSVLITFGLDAAGAHAAPTVHATTPASQSDTIGGGRRTVAYFTQWGIYSGFFEKNLVTNGTAAKLTTIDYAFSGISSDLKCDQVDSWADYQRPFAATESVNGQADTSTQALYGNFQQLRELKQLYPKLKIMISIGGWTLSGNFSAAAEPQNRAAFVQSCINQYIEGNLPLLAPGAAAGIFDGIDIDWEYPDNPGNGNAYGPQDTANFTGLLSEFRTQLDTLGRQTGKHYLLSAALPAGQDKYSNIQLRQIGASLDWGNVMTYDMHGAWDANGPTDFNAPLLCDPRDPSPAPAKTYCINSTVLGYVAAGFPLHKIVLGIPYYGHGWTNVPDSNHGLFQSSPTIQPATLGGGTANYNQLAPLKMTRYWDPLAQTAWYYDGTNFWSYDDPASITLKMEYVKLLGLGGAVAWSLDGDDAAGSLTNAMYQGLR